MGIQQVSQGSDMPVAMASIKILAFYVFSIFSSHNCCSENNFYLYCQSVNCKCIRIVNPIRHILQKSFHLEDEHMYSCLECCRTSILLESQILLDHRRRMPHSIPSAVLSIDHMVAVTPKWPTQMAQVHFFLFIKVLQTAKSIVANYMG